MRENKTTTQTTVGHIGMTYTTIIPAPVANERSPDTKMRLPSVTTCEEIRGEKN